jgi:hypothetical protein
MKVLPVSDSNQRSPTDGLTGVVSETLTLAPPLTVIVVGTNFVPLKTRACEPEAPVVSISTSSTIRIEVLKVVSVRSTPDASR